MARMNIVSNEMNAATTILHPPKVHETTAFYHDEKLNYRDVNLIFTSPVFWSTSCKSETQEMASLREDTPRECFLKTK